MVGIREKKNGDGEESWQPPEQYLSYPQRTPHRAMMATKDRYSTGRIMTHNAFTKQTGRSGGSVSNLETFWRLLGRHGFECR